jgi:hypothetical protein
MAKHMISAEVDPISGQANQAALALQHLGFRILHIGPTISVQGPESLWKSTFHLSFKPVKKSICRDTETEVTYYKPSNEEVQIPASVQNLVARVMFVEPPEFF